MYMILHNYEGPKFFYKDAENKFIPTKTYMKYLAEKGRLEDYNEILLLKAKMQAQMDRKEDIDDVDRLRLNFLVQKYYSTYMK